MEAESASRKRRVREEDTEESKRRRIEGAAVDPAVELSGSEVKQGPSDGPLVSFMYTPGSSFPDLRKYIGGTIEVRIPSVFLSSRNREVVTRQIWGTDVYTDDSDVLAMVIHTGNYLLRADAPSDIAGIAVFLKVLPPKDSYTSSMRYKLKSRSWPSKYLRTSLSVVKLDHVTLMSALEGPGIAGNKLKNMVGRGLSSSIQPSAASTEEVVTGLGTLQLIPDVTIMFNLSNEPCLKYGLSLIGDRGMNQTQWTSWRLKDEVIYFEHQMKRYELSREKETNSITQNSDNELDTSRFDKYRWARVLPKAIYNNEITDVPLPLDLISVLETQIDWDEIEWGPTSVRIRGKCFEITSIQFRKCTSTNQI